MHIKNLLLTIPLLCLMLSCTDSTISNESSLDQASVIEQFDMEPMNERNDGFTDISDQGIGDTGFSPSPMIGDGEIDIQYVTDYLLDNLKSSDASYLSMHRLSIKNTPAFFGRIGETMIAENGTPGVIYEVFGLKSSQNGSISILQMAFDAATNLPVNPFIQLSLDVNLIDINQGYTLSVIDSKSRLMIFNVNEDLSFNCIEQVGLGTVSIPRASDLELDEGGSIEVYASSIVTYIPSQAPVDNLVTILMEEGKNVCSEISF